MDIELIKINIRSWSIRWSENQAEWKKKKESGSVFKPKARDHTWHGA